MAENGFQKILVRVVAAAAAAFVAWALAAAAITTHALPSLRTDFYSSIARDQVAAFQHSVGVRASAGTDWIHAGWIADPEHESYQVYLRRAQDIGSDGWRRVATTRHGSALVREADAGGAYEVKVEAISDADAAPREVGIATVRTAGEAGPRQRPVIVGPWRQLFRPSVAGDYINDHTVFRDGTGRWRLLGITGPGRGDYTAEVRLAHGVAPERARPAMENGADRPPAPDAGLDEPSSGAMPRNDGAQPSSSAMPQNRVAQRSGAAPHDGAESSTAPQATFAELLASGGMTEDEPVADYRQPAWAPHVLRDGAGLFHLFWSPHRLAHAVSSDGAHWYRRPDAIPRASGWFFRDAMVLEVARGQWLAYATSRGWWYSAIDVYQSFDLDHWQRIGTAWQAGRGSERNALVSSAESPFVVAHDGHYYLSLTYNNESGVLAPVLLALGIWKGTSASYNDTLVFASTNPYDFGQWRGHQRPSQLVAELETHAPEFIHDESDGTWYVTTCGWPLAATLTSGEVAAAPLRWEVIAR